MKKLEKKPFALISANVNNPDQKKLKEAMVRLDLNWRSFVSSEAIKAAYNSPGTPCYYVIDPRGVIRQKWVGNPGPEAMEAALEKLLVEAEGANSSR